MVEFYIGISLAVGYVAGWFCGYYKARAETVKDLAAEIRNKLKVGESFNLHVSWFDTNDDDDDDDEEEEFEPVNPWESVRKN